MGDLPPKTISKQIKSFVPISDTVLVVVHEMNPFKAGCRRISLTALALCVFYY